MTVISFPNFLCLLLMVVLGIHLVTRTPTEGSLPELEVTDDLEVIFCKLPQSRRTDDSAKCSSAQKLFSLLRNGCTLEHRMFGSKRNETEEEEQEVTVEVVEEVEEKEEKEEEKEAEMKSTLVDSFVISLLVCSAIASLLEWHRERRNDGKNGVEGRTTVGGEPVNDRRISLVDLTVNRHIRRQDSQHAENTRKNSTQGTRPPLLRRSSFPAQSPEGRPRLAPQRQQSIPATRRMSVDQEEDGSPDRRKGLRIIRRH